MQRPLGFALAASLLVPTLAAAQAPRPASPDTTIDAGVRRQVVDAVVRRLDSSYVFPAVARAMGRDVQARLRRGEYDSLGTARAFGKRLSADLRAVSHDKHIGVGYRPGPLPPDEEWTPEAREELRRELASSNFGFRKVEILEGNIGYLDLHGFAPADVGGATAVAAMQFLANTDALVVDLRRNGGGEPSMISLLLGYFFTRPTHVNGIRTRVPDRLEQNWTAAYVPGQRYGTRPVYVLTSERTISAGEEFAYDLQSQRRATLVGETTAGGANPGETVELAAGFKMFVPSGQATNAATGKTWEGVGIVPDVKVPADSALDAALALARRQIANGVRR